MTKERKHIGVDIRWMVRKELPEVLEIERLSFTHPWTEPEMIEFLRLRDAIGAVAEVDDEVVGFMLYRLRPRNIHLESFAVHPKYRRGGIGYAMIDKLFGKLTPQRRKSITVEVRETNLAAQLFLKSMGFLCIDSIAASYIGTEEDSYLFRYALEEQQPDIYPINRFRGLLGGSDDQQ
jgi:ribosomal-protein-alanine N-acetyltransferase